MTHTETYDVDTLGESTAEYQYKHADLSRDFTVVAKILP